MLRFIRSHQCGVKDGLHWTGVLVRSLVNKALSLLQREKSRESFP